MAEYTRFGLAVKTKLLEHNVRTQTELAKEAAARTGLYVDNAYISRVLTGQRRAPKIVQAIREILDLPEDQDT